MEKSKIIDKSDEELMPRPNFTKLQLKEPYKLEPIVIEPLQPIKIDPGVLLSSQIHNILGIREETAPSIFNSLFGCTQCSACKALSRETLNEISPQDLT